MRSEIGYKLRKSLAKLKFGLLPSLLLLGLILGGRWTGSFQFLEWQAFDAFMRHQAPEAEDERILLVSINEETIRSVVGTYPIPDQQLVKLLNALQRHQPRAIGLDLFRDLPIDPGSAELANAFQTMDNLIGIDKVLPPTVAAPPALPQERLGFSDAPIDRDGRQRRVLLGTQTENGFRFSLALLLAETFLTAEGIQLENGLKDPSTMRFESAELPRVRANFGGYIRTNTGDGDIQMLLNFRKGPKALRVLTFQQILSGDFDPNWVKNRVVIIGVTTQSIQDHFPAAIPSIIDSKAEWVYGIEMHAHAVSQILSATLDQRPLIGTWSELMESLWIVAWGLTGMVIAAYIRTPRYTLLAIALSTILLIISCYGAFLFGWWIPVVPPLSSLLCISLGLAVFYQYDRLIQTQIKAQQQTVAILEQAKADLEIQVANRTSELQQSNVELMQAKDVAEMASRAKGNFLAKMSHELRTPLNAILGFSQMMALDSSLSEANRKRTRLINQSGEHLLGLINDILSLAKLESGKQDLREEAFNLNTLVETIEGIFRLRIEQKGLAFYIDASPHTPEHLVGDAQKLRQVLINLLSNALKFTEAGHIALRIGSLQQPETLCLQFEVEDTGEGIAASELHKLFVPFEQTTSGERSKKGTGLGLPISEQFAHLMGGQLTVSSQVGQGTTFTFTARVAEDIESGAVSTATLENIASMPSPQRREESILPEALTSEPSVVLDQELNSENRSEAIAQTLRSMPAEWLLELHQSALRLKGKQVIHLLQELPSDQAAIAQYLIDLAEDYQYAKITEITEALVDQ